MRSTFASVVLAVALLTPMAVQAQGIVPGARSGAADGRAVAGPVGEIIGGAVGAAVGTVGGILGVDARPRLRQYVLGDPRPVYRYNGDVVVGTVLPSSGVTYYDVPAEYGTSGYRYTHVNDRYVLVDPATRQVVDIIE
ncbi:DUF1236 domain-containing protein [uncultured Methylobacterium sp.]|jgi:hypothetical protein|uniref:DUF1236 domain-containing protein n=1 Tax=uncultured Methylobacterium sp. TaxID=157278 RepID=UPI00261DEEB9|nr:DUF1236 domain-containing protein [uncultured Methylobacterium sp.]